MPTRLRNLLLAAAGVIALSAAVFEINQRRPAATQKRVRSAAPVAVAPIERGPIALERVYAGTLEARAELVVAPRIAGRVDRLLVDLGDTVRRGQLVAELESAELRELLAQAKAGLAVAQASVAAAESALLAAERERERLETLRERGISSQSQLDAARALALTRRAEREVTTAEVTRAQGALEAARVRLGYARLTADWSGGGETRVVGERRVNEGAMVAANAPLLSLVELDPLVAVVFVAERDYAHLQLGQPATLTTDAHPGATFTAEVRRIAPVFSPGSRQARVELEAKNADGRLKPGLFVRAKVVLRSLEEATVVPRAALTTRGDQPGVFLVDAAGSRVAWRPVTPGIREGERVELVDATLTGRVVIVGHQLLDDGSPIVIPDLAP